MDEILQTALLYDFYSGLLTDKQRRWFELYYFDNLSTLEIGESCGVTPQAVWDLLKRTAKILYNYEAKLGLVEKHLARKRTIEEITKKIEEMLHNEELSGEMLAYLQSLEKMIADLLDE